MARTPKTPRYQEFNGSPNAYGRHAQEPRSWITHLDPEIPLNLELGCGKAEISIALAQKYPERNYIGVDLKADRLWRASKTAIALKLDNVAFIQSNILSLQDFIRPQSVAMIWITHPDPFPKERQIKHRMLNRNFLDIYKKVLQKDGFIRIKTDNLKLHQWMLDLLKNQKDIKVLRDFDDLHQSCKNEDLLIETTFSARYIKKGVAIKFIEFRFI